MAAIHDIGKGDKAVEGDAPGIPKDWGTIMHHDFSRYNLLLTDDDQIKVSDLNAAELLKWNIEKNESCRFTWGEKCNGDWVNSEQNKPEVLHLGAMFRFLLTDKVKQSDLFASTGNYTKDGEKIFKIVHGRKHENYTYNGDGELLREIRSMTLQKKFGGHPGPLPPKIPNSTETVVDAIIDAWKATRECDVDRLLTAREIAHNLDKAAVKLGLIKKQSHPQQRLLSFLTR